MVSRSAGERRPIRGSALSALSALLLVSGWALTGSAAPKGAGKPAKSGLDLAKSGDCVAAVPLLERAEAEAHRPATAAALADCHVALGELLLAHEIYAALAAEPADRAWDAADKAASARARKTAADLDARIPKVLLTVEPADLDVEVRVAGVRVHDPSEPIRVPPDEKAEIVVSAKGYATQTSTVLLTEREQKKLRVVLEPTTPPKKDGSGTKEPKDKPPAPLDESPKHWLGARFRGLFIPTFVMNIVGEGGTTTYLPGVGVTYTARLSVVDIEPSVTFTSYNLGPTPFKPRDTPDTEWEIVESDLWGVTASLDILYRIPVSKIFEVRIGAGFGIGYAFAGDLYRWQSYPEDGQPGDPSTYKKCNGPNDPAGTFRYCNQLDKDADRYGAPDATWGDGGARPVVYPWLSLPQISFSFRPIERLAVDLELGATLNGVLTGTAIRIGL
ncbi:MAG: hypothetical protein HOW73_20740 [Polyangiaceae bacterium]|nr:hypothetical protein [Polyangiaceae bacterium]